MLNIPELCLKASLGKNALLLPNGQFSATSLQLHGHSEVSGDLSYYALCVTVKCLQHYALEFVPPIINVLEGVPFGAEVRKRFNVCDILFNHLFMCMQ